MKRKYSLKLLMESYLNEKTYDIESSTQDSARGDEESIKGRSTQTDKETGKSWDDDTDEGTIKDPKTGKFYDYSHEYSGDKESTNKAEGEFSIGNNLGSTSGTYGNIISRKIRGEEKAEYFIFKKGKRMKLENLKNYFKELKKATGISQEGIDKIFDLIMKKDLPGVKELEKETKNLNESLSRGSLYRRKYRRY